MRKSRYCDTQAFNTLTQAAVETRVSDMYVRYSMNYGKAYNWRGADVSTYHAIKLVEHGAPW